MSTPPTGDAVALDCLRAVLALAKQQTAAIEADALDRFNELLDEREALLSRLIGLDAPADATGGAVDETARELIEQDRRNHAALAERLQQVRTEIPVLAAGSRATDAYRRSPGISSAYVDRAS